MLALFFFVFLLESPVGFSGFGIIKQDRARIGIESMPVRWDAKNNPGVTGLHEMLGRDYGIEELYWGPSTTSLSIKTCRRPRPISSHLDLTLGQ